MPRLTGRTSARELTCDNCGCASAGNLEAANAGLKRLAVGNRLLDRLNDDFLVAESKYIYSGLTGWLLKQYLTYPPLGKRGIGGAPRWVGFGHVASQAQIEEANSQILVVAFLEHVAAIENLEEIVCVEGIDAYYVGPADMSLSLGLPGQIDHPKVKEVKAEVRRVAQDHGKYYLDDFIVGERATNMFLEGARAFLEANREALG